MRCLGHLPRSRLAALLPLLLLPALPARAAAREPRTPVVHSLAGLSTWAQLRAQAPIRLVEGGWVRLGLECDALAPRSSGLVYALVGGGARVPRAVTLPDGARALGPLLFRTRSAEGVTVRGIAVREGAPPGSDEATERLYAATALLSGTLPLDVEVLLPGGRVVARGRILPRLAPSHPWMSLRPLDSEAGERAGEAGTATAVLTPQDAPWAAPDVDGMQPLARWNGSGDPPTGALPTLEPTEPDPALGLESTRDGFVLMSTEALPARWIADRLLYRLWVNDHPLRRARVARPLGMARSGGHDLRATRIHVRVDWRLAELGVKPRDRVSLQLLWCPAGWRDGRGRERLTLEVADEHQRPRLTPKVDLVR